MKNYETLITSIEQKVLTVWLNRPAVHNAFDRKMLIELADCFENASLENVSCLILRGKGKSFCAGVELNWMKEVVNNTHEENYQESLLLSKCFYSIYSCSKPVIAVVHGIAMGGGNGLLAACDFVYCTDNTVFALSEVKLGIVPATIAPYIIKRIGEFPSRDLMLTGRKISGKEAEMLRLVNKSVHEDELDELVNSTISLLKTSGPKAVSHCKKLIDDICNNFTLEKAYDKTAYLIADIRASEEGQEGMAAFFEKRKAGWID